MSQEFNESRANETGAAEVLADAPVVVRVELASVTMTAQEWAELSPGGVIATGVKIGSPVMLRAGGALVARGELCELDGEVAVRILERGESDR
ncbi:MAG: FliM/FliN family flagellar motor switch protein [Polyangiaceae bacterium]